MAGWCASLATFGAALSRDIREHPLAWAVIVTGAIAAGLLWAMICGLPLAHSMPYDITAAMIHGARCG